MGADRNDAEEAHKVLILQVHELRLELLNSRGGLAMRGFLPNVTSLHTRINFTRLDDLVLMILEHLARQFEFYNGTDSLLGVSHIRDLRFEIGRYL